MSSTQFPSSYPVFQSSYPAQAGYPVLRAVEVYLRQRGVLDRPLEPVIGRRGAPTRWRTMTAICGPAATRSLQQRVVRAFTFGEQRQRLACDIGLEMRALLMRLEGGFVAEQFVEQELRGIFFRPRNQEQLCAGFAWRLGQEARQDIGDPVGLSFAGFPLRDDQQAAAAAGFAPALVDCILTHGSCSVIDGYSSIYNEHCLECFVDGRSA